MEKFDNNIQWKPPGLDFLITIHRIQSQNCSCCAPLRFLIGDPNENNGQKVILEISSTSKKFMSLYKLLRLYTSTSPTELDALVQSMGSRINEIA